MERRIRILPSFVGASPNMICFGTRIHPQEVRTYDTTFAKREHPVWDAGALRMFYERVLLGQSLPLTLVITEFQNPVHIMASLLFLNPEDTLKPACAGLVNSFDMIDRLGTPAMAHIPLEHKMIFGWLKNYMRHTEHFPEDQWYARLLSAIHTLREFLRTEKWHIHLDSDTTFNIIKSEGSVTAFTSNGWGWDLVWADGTLCGVWVKDDILEIRMKSDLVYPLEKFGKVEDGAVYWEKDDFDTIWEVLTLVIK